tara:strand:- start:114 stop:803 length:690 start_codon:yes stop_codon:yes gene_type:complete
MCRIDISLDIAIAEPIPESGDVSNLTFICGVTCERKKNETGKTIQTWKNASDLILHLWKRYNEDKVRIVSWNGVKFDFYLLANQPGTNDIEKEYCKFLAKKHTDIAFAFLAERGYMISLSSAIGRPHELDPKDIPALWACGAPETKSLVYNYLEDQSDTILNILHNIENNKRLNYINSKGNKQEWKPVMHKDKLLSVRNAMMLDEPDTSYMPDDLKNTFKRDKFITWLD